MSKISKIWWELRTFSSGVNSLTFLTDCVIDYFYFNRMHSRFKDSNCLLTTNHRFLYLNKYDEESKLYNCNICTDDVGTFLALLNHDECDLLLLAVPVIPTALALAHLSNFRPPCFFEDIVSAKFTFRNIIQSSRYQKIYSESMHFLNFSQRVVLENIAKSGTENQLAPSIHLIRGPPGIIPG